MKRFITLVLWCCCLFGFSGCSGEKFPEDFPKVYPMTVTVKDGATPLSEVRVMFFPAAAGAGAAYASSGSTNENGAAKVVTAQGSFSKKGIPAGDFVVTVEDIINIDDGIPPEEIIKMSYSELRKLDEERAKILAEYKRKVPAVLCKTGSAARRRSLADTESIADRSPIRFTATKGKNELLIDVADYK